MGFAFLVSLLLLIFPPVPQFNYDFEQFFPQDNEDLEFYQQYRKDFENDNDYLLIALENPKGPLLKADFLEKSLEVQQEIEALNQVDTVLSILTLRQPIIGVFGVRWQKILEWDEDGEVKTSEDDLENYSSNLISKDGKALLLWIKNSQNISKEDGDLLYQEINKVLEEHQIIPKAVAGKIQAQGDFINLMQQEFGMFFSFSLLLIITMLWLIFRAFWAVWIPLLILVLGTLWSFASMLYFGKPLDVMSTMQPTIFLIVGLSALIHFFTHLISKINAGIPKDQAIQQVFSELLMPVWLTIITTSLGFVSLYFTSIPALKSFGFSTGIGIILMFLAVISISPGLLYLISIKQRKKALQFISTSFLQSCLGFLISSRKLVLISFATISLSGLYLGSKNDINGYLLDNLPQNHPILLDFQYFDEQFGGSNPLELFLETGEKGRSLLDYEVLQEIDKLEQKLKELTGSSHFASPLTLVKSLNQAQNQGNPKAFSLPTPGQYKRLEKYLSRDLGELGIKVISKNREMGRISSRAPDLGTLKMSQIRKDLNEFVSQEINQDLIQVRWTGTAFLIDKGHESVTFQMAKGLGFAFLVVGIIAGILFKSWRISFILLIPNVIPLIWMLGLMYLLGIEFKLTTAILFTVAFGIAVDDSIHFMTRLRFELGKGSSLVYAIKRTFLETGRAIILTSLILVLGFGLLIFSQFGVTHYTGLLIAAALIFALLADLFLLPLLLLPMKQVWEKKKRKLLS
ncbi:efflux RND transporter permease subunit [Algoriphagus pacificus]|nr:MMPL family transporter [Algoriphagus pacificus]